MESLPQTTPPPASTASSPAKVSFSLDGKMLRAHFEVESSDIFGKPTLSQNQYPYMFDVAEIFVSAEGGMPYYEFELTPFNQTFEVRIYYRHPPDQKLAFQDGVNVGIEHKAVRTAGGWMADFGVPLERLGWRGDVSKITGNAFVILGKAPNRHFFSRSLPEQDKANFHHPEFFKSLLSCGNSSAK
jgi:hypothetical protein